MMNNKTAWILITLVLVAAITGLILIDQVYGCIAAIFLVAAFLIGLTLFYKQRANRLMRSILPGEILVSKGMVSESTYDQASAILVHGPGENYRLLISDSRGAVTVQSVSPELKGHENPYDLKRYIEINTIQGPMHFAPANSSLVAGQAAYAQQILDGMLDGALSNIE